MINNVNSSDAYLDFRVGLNVSVFDMGSGGWLYTERTNDVDWFKRDYASTASLMTSSAAFGFDERNVPDVEFGTEFNASIGDLLYYYYF